MPDRDDPPADVEDLLLWRLAVTIAGHHRPDPAGRCAHPICAGASWPCGPHRQATLAERAARTAATAAVGRVVVTEVGAAVPSYRPRRPWATRWAAVTHPTPPATVESHATESAVLDLLRHRGPASTDEVAARLGIAPAAASAALARLRQSGLVTPLAHP